MNSLIISELYQASLFCKMAHFLPYQLTAEDPENDVICNIKKFIKGRTLVYVDKPSVKCYLFTYQNTIYIILHLTAMYYVNKNLEKYKDKICVHKGLLEQYKVIEDTIISYINSANKLTTKKIYVIGHYMGGGLATITAAILGEMYKYIYLITCISFESPKVGNKAFVKYFKEFVTCNYRVIADENSRVTLDHYNCYTYYKYKYTVDKLFVENGYHHVSDCLLLKQDNIQAFARPSLTITEKLLQPFYLCDKIENSSIIIGINNYIQMFDNILTEHKINYARSQSLNTYAKESSETSSAESSKTFKTGSPTAVSISPDDISLLSEKLDRLLEKLNSKVYIQ